MRGALNIREAIRRCAEHNIRGGASGATIGAESGQWGRDRRMRGPVGAPDLGVRRAWASLITAHGAADHAPFPHRSRAGRLDGSIVGPGRACVWATGATPTHHELVGRPHPYAVRVTPSAAGRASSAALRRRASARRLIST